MVNPDNVVVDLADVEPDDVLVGVAVGTVQVEPPKVVVFPCAANVIAGPPLRVIIVAVEPPTSIKLTRQLLRCKKVRRPGIRTGHGGEEALGNVVIIIEEVAEDVVVVATRILLRLFYVVDQINYGLSCCWSLL